MKTCPCCNSRTFDDMDTCFVCMHRFADSQNSSTAPAAISSLGEVAEGALDELVESPRADAVVLERADVKPSAAGEGLQQVAWNCTDTLCEDAFASPQPDVQTQTVASWGLGIELKGFPEYSYSLSKNGERITIGRSADNDIIVPDLRVSRKHAEMFVSQDRLWIVDCGSKNMTVLDGIPVVGTREVLGRATVQIGAARIEVSPMPVV